MPDRHTLNSAGLPRAKGDQGQQPAGGASALKPPSRSTVALGVCCALMAAGVTAVALREFPSFQFMNRDTVMAAAFIPYGLLAFGAAAVVFATSPRRWLRPIALVAVAGLALQGWWTRPYWPATPPAATAGTEPLTLVSMKLRCNPGGIPDLTALIQRSQPDVVIVEGLQLDESASLGAAWGQLLPYSTFHAMPQLAKCGTVVFSRTPVKELTGAADAPPVIEVDRPNSPFVLLPIDFPTPSNGVAPWLDAFTHLTQAATAYRGQPMVVVGDFNAVREHVPMRTLLQTTGLRDAAEVSGSGGLPSFPSTSWCPPLIGLDHALVSSDLGASGARTEAIRDQGHRALLVTIHVPRQKP